MLFKNTIVKRVFWSLFFVGFIYGVVLIGRSIDYYTDNIKPTYSNISEDPHLYPWDPDFCFKRCEVIDDEFLVKDDNGVYMVDFTKVKNVRYKNGRVYFPMTIGQLGVVHHIRYKRFKNDEDLKILLAQADWFGDNLNEHGCWQFTNDTSLGNGKVVKAPWCSGMGQGLAFSALVAAYRETGEQKYIDVAMQGLGPFDYDNPFTVVSYLEDGSTMYEEVGTKEYPISILNGFIFALVGLKDLADVTKDPYVTKLYKDGMATLEKNLHLYEVGNWSLYSLDDVSSLSNHWRYVSPKYQRLYTMQFQALADMTQEQVYKDAYLRHKSYLEDSPINLIIIPAYLAYGDLSLLLRLIK